MRRVRTQSDVSEWGVLVESNEKQKKVLFILKSFGALILTVGILIIFPAWKIILWFNKNRPEKLRTTKMTSIFQS